MAIFMQVELYIGIQWLNCFLSPCQWISCYMNHWERQVQVFIQHLFV